jgi:tRNA modification GTPase
MTTHAQDTIAALATPAGRGGIGIVRIAGPGARAIGAAMLDALPVPRYATVAWFHDAAGNALDRGLALFFEAPHSYTGDDVLELHAHGGPLVTEALLAAVLGHGARLAEPGEFTRRAYVNGKLDLAQAEAVIDLINSATAVAARAAARSLKGEFSARVDALVSALTDLRVHVEAAIDFPEEEIDFLHDPELDARIAQVLQGFASLQQSARQGQRLRDGLTIVIAGKPNAGKSSLLNRLAGHDAAIVTDRPGTTRDVLRADIHIDGMPLHVIDTAGLRESDDPVEVEGVRRAHAAMAGADLVLLVQDATAPAAADPPLPAGVPVTVVRNKADLLAQDHARPVHGEHPTLYLSARTGAGLDALAAHLRERAGFDAHAEGNIIARRRHLDALARAHTHVLTGARELREHAAGEIMAEELRLAQQCLGEITGEVTSDALLGEIFSRFCIGK